MFAEMQRVRGMLATNQRSCVRVKCAAFLVVGAAAIASGQVPGVGPREYPAREYYLVMPEFEAGEFGAAVKDFRSAANSGVRTTEGRWVDSICYFTMMGECFFQMGETVAAREQYEAALNLFLAYPNWMLRVDFPPVIGPSDAVPRRPVTWGVSTRRTVVGRFADRYPLLQGRLDNANVIRQGGVLALPEYVLVNVHEIVRCTAIALRRRREIMGVTCRHDPLTARLVAVLSSRPAPPNHWSQAWVGVLLGIALASEAKTAEAVTELQSSLQVAGQFDHPLTPTALVELGKLAFEQEQYAVAAGMFLEATHSAAWFGQLPLLEESFRWATWTHIVGGGQGMYAPLEPAMVWSRRTSRFLETSLLVDAAHNAVEIGQTAAAAGLVDQARRAMVRTSMPAGSVGARLQYVSAVANYQAGNAAAGDVAFTALLAYQRRSSLRLYELGLVDSLFTSGAISDKIAEELFSQVLREPAPRDWLTSPVETLTLILTPHFPALEHWLEVAREREEWEKVFEIADLIRRRRFFATLPSGGRALALTWILDADPELLTDRARLQRRDLLTKYPRYAELANRALAIRTALRKGPLAPEDAEGKTRQGNLLAELGLVSQQQELIVREMSLRRWPSDFLFPPPLDFKRFQSDLPDGQLVLSFLATTRSVYGMGFGKGRYPSCWTVQVAPNFAKELAELLRQMAVIDRNQPVDAGSLKGGKWKELSAGMLRRLTNDAKPEMWRDYRELAIVPDGILWYLPFEALQIPEPERGPLIASVPLRYAPTLSLIPPDPRTFSPHATTGVVMGRIAPRDDEDAAAKTVKRLKEVMSDVVELEVPLPAPSDRFAILFDRLVVLHDLEDTPRTTYDWTPLQIDRGRPGSTLASWIALPWGGPRQIILPGFHSAAEGMGRRSSNGEDVFLGLCGLMATGARTVLLSRWRTGGQTCNELVREFVQELPHQSAPAAWQRSVQLLRGTTVVAEAEPRVKVSEAIDVDISADHPFFWAGYLLVDSGSRPLSEKPAGKPAEKPAPAAKAPADDKPKPAAESAEPEKTETKPKVTEDTPEPPKKPTGPAVP